MSQSVLFSSLSPVHKSFRLSGRFSTVLLLCWAKRRLVAISNSSLLLITLHVVFVYGLDYLATMAEDGLWDVFSSEFLLFLSLALVLYLLQNTNFLPSVTKAGNAELHLNGCGLG